MKKRILKGGLSALALLSLSSNGVAQEYITHNVKQVNSEEKKLEVKSPGDKKETFNASFFQEQGKSSPKISFDRNYTIKEKEDIEKYLKEWRDVVAKEEGKFDISEDDTKKAFAKWKEIITTDEWNKNQPLAEFMEAYSYYQFDKLVTNIAPYGKKHPLYQFFPKTSPKDIDKAKFEAVLKGRDNKKFVQSLIQSFIGEFNYDKSLPQILQNQDLVWFNHLNSDATVELWNKHNVHADLLLKLFEYSDEFFKVKIDDKERQLLWKSSPQYQEFVKSNNHQLKHHYFAKWRNQKVTPNILREIFEAKKIEIQVKEGETTLWKPYLIGRENNFKTLFTEKGNLIYTKEQFNLTKNIKEYGEILFQWLNDHPTFKAFVEEEKVMIAIGSVRGDRKELVDLYTVFQAFKDKWLPLFKKIYDLKTERDKEGYYSKIELIRDELFKKKYVSTSKFEEIKNSINLFNVPLIKDIETKEIKKEKVLLTHLQNYVLTHHKTFDFSKLTDRDTLTTIKDKVFGTDKKAYKTFLDDYYIKAYLASDAIAKEDQFVLNQYKMENLSTFVNSFWPLNEEEKITYSKTGFITWVNNPKNDQFLKLLFKNSSYYQDKYVDESIKKVKTLMDATTPEAYKKFYENYVKDWIQNEQIPYDDILPFVKANNRHSFAYIFQRNSKVKKVFHKIFKAFYDSTPHHKAWLQSIRGDNVEDKGAYQGYYESKILRDFVANQIKTEYSDVEKFDLLQSRYMYNQQMGRTFTELGGGYAVGPGADKHKSNQKWEQTYHRVHLIDSDFLVKYYKNPVNFDFKKQWEKKFDDAYENAKSDFFKNRYNSKLVSTLIGVEDRNWMPQAIWYWKFDADWAFERSLFKNKMVKNEIIDMMLSHTFSVGEITSVDVKYQDHESGASQKDKYKGIGLVSNVRDKKNWKTKWKDIKAENPLWDDLKAALKEAKLDGEIDLIHAANKLSGVDAKDYAVTTTSDAFYKNATYAWVNHKLKNYFVKKSSDKQVKQNFDLRDYFTKDKFAKDFAAKLKTLQQDQTIAKLKDQSDAFSKGVLEAYRFDQTLNSLNNDFVTKSNGFEKWFKNYKRYIKNKKSYEFFKIKQLKLPLVKSFISDDEIKEVKTLIEKEQAKDVRAITIDFEQWRDDIEKKWSPQDFVTLYNLFKKGITYENQVTRGKDTYVAMGYLKWEEKPHLINKHRQFIWWLDDNSKALRKIFNSPSVWVYDPKDQDIKGSPIKDWVLPKTVLKEYQLTTYLDTYEGANIFEKKLLTLLFEKKEGSSFDFEKFVDYQKIDKDLISFTKWVKDKSNFKYVKELYKDPHNSKQDILDINTWITNNHDRLDDSSKWHSSAINYRVDQITYDDVINHTYEDDESGFATAKDVFVNRFKKWYEGEINKPTLGSKMHTFYLWKQVFEATASKLAHNSLTNTKRKLLKTEISKIKGDDKNINSYYHAYQDRKKALINIVDPRLHQEAILQVPSVIDYEKKYLDPKISVEEKKSDAAFNKLLHLEQIANLINEDSSDYVVKDLKPGKKNLLPYFKNWYQVYFHHIKSAITKSYRGHTVRNQIFEAWKKSEEYQWYKDKVNELKSDPIALDNWKNYYHNFCFDKWATSKSGEKQMWKLFENYTYDAKDKKSAYQKALAIYNTINSLPFNKQKGEFIVTTYQLKHLQQELRFPFGSKVDAQKFKKWISDANNQKLVKAMFKKWGVKNPTSGRK